jgi:predicted nucleic acid-binding protein
MEIQMICLDTNYLILGLVPGSAEGVELIAWARSGTPLISPMPAWYEFLCGPVTPVQVKAKEALLKQIVPFESPQATTAAQLLNQAGRKRALRVDAMIAATALVSGARLATNNQKDFALFVPLGLQFA